MSIAAAFERMMGFLTPPEFDKDLQTQKRVQMFIYSHVLGPFVGNTVPITLAYIDPHPWPQVPILALSISLFWPFLLLLRLFPGAYVQLCLLSVCNVSFAMLWGIFHYGGASSPFLVWVVLIPLLTFLYLGATWVSKVFVLVLSAVTLGALYLLFLFEGFPNRINVESMTIPGLVSAMGVILYTYMMSLYYTSVVDNQSELVREIGRHKETMAELQLAKDLAEEAQAVAERANAAKTAFLARMSHELRTPLNAVLGYSELLLETGRPIRSAEETTDLERIGAAGRHLLAMVDDILDLSKIEAGKTRLYYQPVPLNKLIDEVAGTAAVLAKVNQNRLFVDCPVDLGIIMGDGTKIRQAMFNLIGNAAKFTKNGAITLAVKRYSMDDENWLDIAVRDTGIGISSEEQSRLFTNFSQANSSIAKLYGGSGLGLSLSQNLCRLMGGSISLESSAGLGSTFTIHLPLNTDIKGDAQIGGRDTIIFQPEGRRPFDIRARQIAQDHSPKPEYDGMVEEAEADLKEKLDGFHGLSQHLRDNTMRPRVMVCDLDQTYLSQTARSLLRLGYAPFCVDDPSQVLKLARTARPSIVMLSDRLEASGDVNLKKIFSQDTLLNNIPVIRIGYNQKSSAHHKTTQGFLSFSSPLEELKVRLKQVISDDPNISLLRFSGGS